MSSQRDKADMGVGRPSEYIGSAADRVADQLQSNLGADLRTIAEYTTDDYRLLYVSDAVIEEYGGEDAVGSAADRIHRYLNMDLLERQLFEDMAQLGWQTQALVTRFNQATWVRYLIGEVGVFVSVSAEANVDTVVDILKTLPDE